MSFDLVAWNGPVPRSGSDPAGLWARFAGGDRDALLAGGAVQEFRAPMSTHLAAFRETEPKTADIGPTRRPTDTESSLL